jgi:hypothetical protein
LPFDELRFSAFSSTNCSSGGDNFWIKKKFQTLFMASLMATSIGGL